MEMPKRALRVLQAGKDVDEKLMAGIVVRFSSEPVFIVQAQVKGQGRQNKNRF